MGFDAHESSKEYTKMVLRLDVLDALLHDCLNIRSIEMENIILEYLCCKPVFRYDTIGSAE